MKQCTYCGTEYDDTATECALDREPLRTISSVPPTRKQEEEKRDRVVSAPTQSTRSIIFPRQIGRVSFIVRYILFLIAVAMGIGLLVISESAPSQVSIVLAAVAVFWLLFTLVYFARFILLARIRDIGIDNLFGVLIFVPVVNVLFLIYLAVTEKKDVPELP
jgi:hypothetical protein